MVNDDEMQILQEFDGGGIVRALSPRDFNETRARLTSTIEARGLKIYMCMNHSDSRVDECGAVRPTEVLLFGSPDIERPLLNKNQSLGLELPLVFMVYEDEHGSVWLSFKDLVMTVEHYEADSDDDLIIGVQNLLIDIVADVTNGAECLTVH